MMRHFSCFVTGTYLLAAVAASSAAGAEAAVSPKTAKEAQRAIHQYMERDAKVKGAFLLLDPRTGSPLVLNFDHVHEGVESHADGLAACVDFKDANGVIYDVDVVVERSRGYAVRQVFLHKVDGKPLAAPEKRAK